MQKSKNSNCVWWEGLRKSASKSLLFSTFGKIVSMMVLMLFAFPALAQSPKTITLSVNNASVASVMNSVEQQSGYSFFYNSDDVDVNRKVTLSLKDSDLPTALNALFRNSGVSWSVDDTHIILKKAASPRPQTPQESGSGLTGTVTDRYGEPVIGAVIIASGDRSKGAVTDFEGNYFLPWSDSIADDTIEITLLGYVSQNIPVNGRHVIDIVLAEDSEMLEATVITALGIKRSERSNTYAVQTLDKDIFNTRDANLVNSIQGKLAGVQVNSSSAGPGAETKVVMRGAKSISNSNNALYVLDGIPLPELSKTSPGDSYSIYDGSSLTGDGISNFNADDFGSMTALVGPSAAALYGYKAANGVLMLTTRSAEGEGISVDYSTNTTFSSPLMLPNFQSRYGAATGMYTSWGNALNTAKTWSVKDFFQTGYNTQHSVSLSIGHEHSSTYVSAAYNDARGIIPNNEYTRYNFTFHQTVDFLNDKMHLSLLGMYMNVFEQNMTSGGQYYNPLIALYLMSPSDDLNNYAVYERYDASRNFKTQYWPWGTLNLQAQNPYWIVNRNMFTTKKNRFLFGASLEYNITDWLDLTGRVRRDYNNSLAEQKNYASTTGTFAGDYGRYFWDESTTNQTYADVMANVHKNFIDDKLSLTLAVGASIEDYRYVEANVSGDLLGVANLFTFANMDTNRGFAKTTYNDQVQSVFATAQIGWRNMIFLDLTLRNDWNTALVNTDSMSNIYPSVGISGVLTDIFNVDSNWFSFAKVRASYAEVGNPIMRFLTVPTYSVSDGQPTENTYATSDDFGPERTRSWEVGADLKFWGNKVNVSATYYRSKTDRQVFTPEVSSSSIYNTIYVNSGSIRNQGVELSLNLNQNLGPVDWSSTFIYSINRNKILELLNTSIDGTSYVSSSLSVGGTSGIQLWLTEGGSIGDLYVRGLKTDEHGYIWVSPTTSGVVAADTDDGLESLIYAGNTNPSWTGSWRNDFNWNGITLGVLVTARIGGVGASYTEATMDYYGVSKRTADDRDAGGALVNGQRIPAQAYYQTIGGNGVDALGAYYIYSLTNIRLSELTIGYNVPIQKWVPFIKNFNVSLVGRNLLMLYCKAPFDPEQVSGTGNYSSGLDYFMMPSTRNIGFSVKLTL